MEIGIPLAVRVAAEVDGKPVDEDGDVGAVIGVEAAEEILPRLAATLVLADHEPGNETQEVARPALREQLEVFPGNEDLRGRGDRWWRCHRDGRQGSSLLVQEGRWRRFLLGGRRRLLLERRRRLRRGSLLGERDGGRQQAGEQ